MNGRHLWLVAMFSLAAACPSGPAAAQAGAVAAFDRHDPRYARLNALDRAGDALMGEARGIASRRGEVIAAWTRLREAALAMPMPDGGPHPLAAVAEIRIAAQRREDGAIKDVIAPLETALVRLAPYRQAYFMTYAEGVALLAQSKTETGDSKGSRELLARGVAEYDEWFARLPEERRTMAAWTGKSNMEYALAFALGRSGEREAAVDMQRRALATRSAGLGPHHPDTVSAIYWLAHFLQQAGRFDEADRHARQAVAIAVAHVDERHPSYARAYEMLGLVLSRGGRAEEAVGYLSRALEIKRQYSADLYLGYAQHNLASIMLDLERYADSRALLAEAAATMRSKEGAGSTQALGSLAYAGQAALAQGETGRAESELAGVLAAMRAAEVADSAMLQRAWVPLVLARIDAGKAAEAASLAREWTARLRGNDRAAQTLAAQAMALQALAERAEGEQARAAGLQLLDRLATARLIKSSAALTFEDRLSVEIVLRLAASIGDAELGLRAMDYMAASKIAQSGRLLAQRLLASDARLAAAVREVQDLALAAQTRDGEVLAAWAAGKDAAAPEAARDEARRKLADARSAIAARFPEWAAATAGSVPTLARIREGLARGEALVGAVPAFEGLFVLTVTRGEATIRKAAIGREAAGNLVASIQASLAARAFDGRAAHALHQALFSPVEARALRGIDRLRVVTGGALATLPLSLLLERPAERIGGTAPWLVRRYAMAQQAGFLPIRRSSLARGGEQRFLGVGAPAGLTAASASGPAPRLQAASAYYRGGEVDRSALGALPALPGAEAELRHLSSWYGAERSTLLTGSAASEASLLGRDLKPFSLILFATHGLVGGRSEGLAESALVLSLPDAAEKDRDGLLTVSEISRLELDADWVILSACDTAAGQTLNSEAYSGLAQAFLYAGARALLVSHWPVRDDAASFLTMRTVDAARRGGSKAQALRKAQLALMADRKLPDAAQPHVWAPFVLLGD